MYVSYTQEIINKIKLPEGFEIIDFSIRVDGSGYMYVKHKSKIFEKIFTYEEMKQPVDYWVENLPKIIHNYFYDWAVRKGYRKL